MRRIYHK